MGIHGSDCHKPFPQSDPPQIFFVSSGGWGEEYNKVCRGSQIAYFYMECSGTFAEVEGHTLLDHFATPSGVSIDNSEW